MKTLKPEEVSVRPAVRMERGLSSQEIFILVGVMALVLLIAFMATTGFLTTLSDMYEMARFLTA